MKLSPDELKLFHRLHSNLMQYALGKRSRRRSHVAPP